MRTVFLDFETYYSSDYSLKKQKYNLSSYIRDEQFLIHGCAFKVVENENVGSTYWISGHERALEECRTLLQPGTTVVAHNCYFESFILWEHLLSKISIQQLSYIDTIGLAKATLGPSTKCSLAELSQTLNVGTKGKDLVLSKGLRRLSGDIARKIANYAKTDVDLCYGIYKKLIDYMPLEERRLMDITIKMFCEPALRVDTGLVESVIREEQERKNSAVVQAKTLKERLMSNKQFAELLEEHGCEVPKKISPTTGKETYAFAKTDEGFRALLNHDSQDIRFLAEARMEVKSTINETRAERLLEAGKNGWPLPVLLNYAAAHTYRWTGGNRLNLQNFPKGGNLRRAICTPEGYVLFISDLSQIEARLNVWFCNQADILDAFRHADNDDGPDIYQRMAAKLFGKRPDEISGDERFVGKICVLALGYGMGWKRLQTTLAIGFAGNDPKYISESEAQLIVQKYRHANPKIMIKHQMLSDMLIHMAVNKTLDIQQGPVRFLHGMVELPSGLALRYPKLRVEDTGFGRTSTSFINRYGRTKIYGGFLLENIIQALARCVIGEQMLAIADAGFKIATMSHDEVVLVVEKSRVDEVEEVVPKIMTTPPLWAPDLPLNADWKTDTRYTK